MAPLRGQLWPFLLESAQNGPLLMGAPVGAKTVKVPQIQFQRGGRWLGCGCSQPLVPSVPGSRLSVMEAFESFSFFTCRSRRADCTWKSGLLYLCPRFLQSLWVWVLPVEHVFDFSGRERCLVQQWIHMLREALGEFQYFLRCGELES